jgi:hypothetical protein
MERPQGLSRDPFTDMVPVRDRRDMEVDHEDPEDGVVYYRDKVEENLFFMGSNGRRVDA